ncbi:hypothetical protein EVAR_66077_1 [Eumeta japonica]|uniref:Uncharacterized protein n=1 Tax=Eumeta variegata TaxID=151549 RepID=A0A4C2A1Q3_EUMVA|nr:hypothetical protein EVAR_66077_1 [Eumeta japonica]
MLLSLKIVHNVGKSNDSGVLSHATYKNWVPPYVQSGTCRDRRAVPPHRSSRPIGRSRLSSRRAAVELTRVIMRLYLCAITAQVPFNDV